MRRRLVISSMVLGTLGLLTPAARGDSNDLVLSRLGEVAPSDGGAPSAIGSSQDFRALASELGVVLAPRLSMPADTLGFGGFQFTADIGFTEVHTDQSHWRALESSTDPAAANHGASTMTTVGFFARKGLWFPVPSFEVGFGAVHLKDSHLWAGQFYGKVALLEGYHRYPVPSLALRGAVSRMMGQQELNLTVASIDATASKDFGIGGMVRASPYLGWNWLLIVPRSEVIDKTPHIDARTMPMDSNMNFTFVDQDSITRHRLFAGVRATYHVFTVGLEAAIALAGSSTDDRDGTTMPCSDLTAPSIDCDATDTAASQTTFTITGGFDF